MSYLCFVNHAFRTFWEIARNFKWATWNTLTWDISCTPVDTWTNSRSDYYTCRGEHGYITQHLVYKIIKWYPITIPINCRNATCHDAHLEYMVYEKAIEHTYRFRRLWTDWHYGKGFCHNTDGEAYEDLTIEGDDIRTVKLQRICRVNV